MLVVRGSGETVEADRALTARIRTHAASERDPAIRVWRPPRQVAFGRRDLGADGYDRANRIARQRGYAATDRFVGGRAVAYHGSTVAFARAEPIDDPREGLQRRYDRVGDAIQDALVAVGIDPRPGEPEDAFCPGSHSLSARGGKVAGIAQRVTGDAALVAGIVVPRDRWPLAEILEDVYDALAVPFDPQTVGSVAAAGGDPDPDALVDAIEEALVGQREAVVREV